MLALLQLFLRVRVMRHQFADAAQDERDDPSVSAPTQPLEARNETFGGRRPGRRRRAAAVNKSTTFSGLTAASIQTGAATMLDSAHQHSLDQWKIVSPSP